MTDQYMAYDHSQLKLAGDGSTTAAEDMRNHVAGQDAQDAAHANWPDPYNDMNDIIAQTLKGMLGAFRQMRSETGHSNTGAHEQDVAAIHATRTTIAAAEDANSGMVQEI